MVQIQSSMFPLIDINPQTWVPNIFAAKASDFESALHGVMVKGPQTSRIDLRILKSGK